MNQKLIPVIGVVGLILVIFIVLGAKNRNVVHTPASDQNMNSSDTISPPTATPTPAPTPSPTPVQAGTPTTNNIGSSEKDALLNFNEKTATKAESAAHHELLVRLATQTDALEIGPGCIVTPFVARYQLKQKVTIRNTDNTLHTLKFYNSEVSVAAGKAETVEADFGHGDGQLEGYICDPTGNEKDRMAGFVQIGEFK